MTEHSSPTSVAASSPEPSTQRSHESTTHSRGERIGVTPDNKKTKDMLDTYLSLSTYALPEYITVGLWIAHLIFFFCCPWVPSWVYAVEFVIWRLAYNLGLGLLLRAQSQNEVITKWYSRLNRRGKLYKLIRNSLVTTMGKDYVPEKYPNEFNAWLVFRYLENTVLGNDSAAYIAFALVHFQIPTEITLTEITCYVLGLLLCAFNLWAKRAAHRVVGDYAWFWGDFFFRMEQELTFEGIFQMFPHPMYTVGYSLYYGVSLITRCPTVLYIGLFAHFCQIMFLVFFEDPHIEKVYGNPLAEEHSARSRREELLSDQQGGLGYFRKQSKDLILLWNLDVFRPTDVCLLMIMALTFVLFVQDLHWMFYFGQAVVWRCLHSFFLGYVLQQQSKKRAWTRHYEEVGRTPQEAFHSFKALYNISLTMNYVVFVAFAIKIYELPQLWSQLLAQGFGLLAIAINIWSSYSSYQVLGPVGWFYGDFFISELPPHLSYGGVYRYFNNPDLVTGYAGLYGLALLCHSWRVFALAVFFQMTHLLFQRFVETPHMKALYGAGRVRTEGGVSRTIKEGLNTRLKPLADQIKPLRERVKTKKDEVAGKVVEQVGMRADKVLEKLRQMAREARM